MIKLTVNNDNCHIDAISGDEVDIMFELCTLVKAVCRLFTEDEKRCSIMVLMVSKALEHGELIKWDADHEDDENDDF